MPSTAPTQACAGTIRWKALRAWATGLSCATSRARTCVNRHGWRSNGRPWTCVTVSVATVAVTTRKAAIAACSEEQCENGCGQHHRHEQEPGDELVPLRLEHEQDGGRPEPPAASMRSLRVAAPHEVDEPEQAGRTGAGSRLRGRTPRCPRSPSGSGPRSCRPADGSGSPSAEAREASTQPTRITSERGEGSADRRAALSAPAAAGESRSRRPRARKRPNGEEPEDHPIREDGQIHGGVDGEQGGDDRSRARTATVVFSTRPAAVPEQMTGVDVVEDVPPHPDEDEPTRARPPPRPAPRRPFRSARQSEDREHERRRQLRSEPEARPPRRRARPQAPPSPSNRQAATAGNEAATRSFCASRPGARRARRSRAGTPRTQTARTWKPSRRAEP